ncbi:hypothetical protein HYDPIDRAFT_119039 [Hydnomerulius pinastri MD-312]|uniref:Uncharacterized protein n=1 Tax=Hydnomerulius pinastri MD-312 TaxID=994086 RepID=A0A0C9V0X4_9AGAM|nr:hypothetical protein HYDPIDRAFT_119039 [Hydnomerulius pinastri MD-312]
MSFHKSKSCERLQIAVYTVAALEMAVNQGVISLRVWHLFTHNSIIRGAVTIIYLVCIVAIVVFLFMSLGLAPTSQEGCGAMLHIAIFWRVYLPAVILHSVLYLFTVLRTLGSTWRGMSGIGRRFISEGGPMYLVATCSLLYSLIASKLIDEPEAYIPAIESYFSQSMVSIAVCHAMLSIRTLAARYDVDPTWLLSHAELSRLRWKRGPDGEVVVDCEFPPDDENVELAQLPSVAQPKVAHPTSRPSTGASFMST